MKILAFNTSNNTTSVAVSDGDKILSYQEDLRLFSQAESLIPMIEGVLIDSKLSYKEIDFLGVINGPGSFNGIRISLASAQGILLFSDIKGVAVTNFEMYHFQISKLIKYYDKIIIALKACKDYLYVQYFTKHGISTVPKLLHKCSLVDIIINSQENNICAGNGIETIYSDIKNSAKTTILLRVSRIKAFYICKYLSQKLQSSESLVYTNKIQPLYLRNPTT